MKNIPVTLIIDTKKLNTLIERTIENLVEMESNSLHECAI